MIAATAIIRKNPRIAARVVDGKALVVVLDDKRLHTLNPVGTRVWELCEGRSVGDVARALCEEFEVDEATALSDVQAFVQELRELGALQIEEAA